MARHGGRSIGPILIWLFPLLLAAVGLAGLAVRYGPAVRFTLALAAPTGSERAGSLAANPAHESVTVRTRDGHLEADLYRAPRADRGLLLVHGLSRAGRRHPELSRLARELARHGYLALVPEFPGLTEFRLTGHEVENIRAGLSYLAGVTENVGVAGFSFGAGPALLAGADVPWIRVHGSFGGYADLRHVIAYITTGVHTFGGRRYVQRQEEYNRWKLLALLAGFAGGARDRGLLQAIAQRKLANPLEETGALEAELGAEGLGLLAVTLNRREEMVAMLLDRLPRRAQEALDRLSPVQVIPRLRGRVLIAHGGDDDSIPFTESLRLAEAARGRARVVILETFHHTGPQRFWDSLSQRARDGWNLFRLVDDLLAAR